jgi:hypothetical protein
MANNAVPKDSQARKRLDREAVQPIVGRLDARPWILAFRDDDIQEGGVAAT